ncbi:hypothetical protein D3C73_991330 [compost metagenome]
MSIINLITKDTNLDGLLTKYDWDAYMGGMELDVYDIEGHVHTYSSSNRNSLWCCPRGEKPTYVNLMEYSGRYGASWGIHVDEIHYTKTKYGECEVRKNCRTWITRNGKNFYHVDGNDFDFCITEAKSAIYKFKEHPISFGNQDYIDQIVGRKIFWKEQPATIIRYSGMDRVTITPENPNGFNPPCYLDKDEIMDREDQFEIVEDILSNSIWWFRD